MVTEKEEVVLPNVQGIIWLISGVAALLCVAVALVLDGIAAWKKDKASYGLGKAAVIVCGIRAGNYIFEKEK